MVAATLRYLVAAFCLIAAGCSSSAGDAVQTDSSLLTATTSTGADPSTDPGNQIEGGDSQPAASVTAEAAPGQEYAGEVNTFFVSTQGDNANPGTFDSPWRTLPFAVTSAPPGATVVALPGDFTEAHNGEAIVVNRRESVEDPFELIGIDQPLITSGGDISGIRVVDSENIIIDGFRLRGEPGSRHGTGIFITDFSHDVTVRNTHVSDFGGSGIGVDFGDRIIVEDNWIENNNFGSKFQTSGLSSFRAQPVGDDNWMRFSRNIVIGNFNEVPSDAGVITDGNCIIIDLHNDTNYFGRVTIDSNLCVENGGRGIHVFHSSNVVATNNTLIANVWSAGLEGAGELSANDSTDVVFANNLVLPTDAVPPLALVRTGVIVVEGNFVAGPDGADGFTRVEVADLGFGDPSCDLPYRYAPTLTSPVVAQSIGAFEAFDLRGIPRTDSADVGAIEATADQLC
ncbi:MAG: parallel beta-helix repeat protein [Acidimicrobiales bacterium]